jgi:hypothetical protein
MKLEQIILRINTDKKFKKEFLKSFLLKNNGRAKLAKQFNLKQEYVRLALIYLKGKEGIKLSDKMTIVYQEYLKLRNEMTITQIANYLKKDFSTIRACYWYSVGKSMNFSKIYE